MTPSVAVWQIQAFLHCRQRFLAHRREAKKSVLEKENEKLRKENAELATTVKGLESTRDAYLGMYTQLMDDYWDLRNGRSHYDGALARIANSQTTQNMLGYRSGSLLDAANRQR